MVSWQDTENMGPFLSFDYQSEALEYEKVRIDDTSSRLWRKQSQWQLDLNSFRTGASRRQGGSEIASAASKIASGAAGERGEDALDYIG
jgi:hypothetical protein